MDCFVSTNKLNVKTKDGTDFWTNNDWIAEWELYFNVRNGIFVDTTPLTGHEKPLKVNSVGIEDIPKYFYTKVNIAVVLLLRTMAILTIYHGRIVLKTKETGLKISISIFRRYI